MLGNTGEWLMDWYADGYDPEDLIDPKGPTYKSCQGMYKGVRSGFWYLDDSEWAAVGMWAADRGTGGHPEGPWANVGCRLTELLG